MIKLIVGGKGSGKTKKMIEMINESATTTPGNIVCIEKSMKLTYDVSHAVRLIDVDEYKISGYDMLYGFITGVLAGNYDIVEVYLDVCSRSATMILRVWASCWPSWTRLPATTSRLSSPSRRMRTPFPRASRSTSKSAFRPKSQDLVADADPTPRRNRERGLPEKTAAPSSC